MRAQLKFYQRLAKPALWKEIAKTISTEVEQAQIFLTAGSLAYTTILSMVPLLAVSFAIFQAFGGMEKLYSTLQPFILSNLSEGANEKAIEQLQSFVSNANASTLGIGGLIALLFTSFSMLSSVEKAINRVWGTKIERSLFQRISTYWLFITLGPLGAAVLIGFATTAKLPMGTYLPGGTGLFILSVGFFFALYKFIPSCRVHWRYALISGAYTSAILGLAKIGFNIYVRRVVSYDRVYGSLGAIPIILLWIYILWVITLSGAALTASLQKRLGTQPVEHPRK